VGDHTGALPDRWEIGPDYLTLAVTAVSDRVELGEPVQLSWTLTNTSARSASVPSEVTSESTYARITVIDATGRRRAISPFVIEMRAVANCSTRSGCLARGKHAGLLVHERLRI
jgi:hypothetical protein